MKERIEKENLNEKGINKIKSEAKTEIATEIGIKDNYLEANKLGIDYKNMQTNKYIQIIIFITIIKFIIILFTLLFTKINNSLFCGIAETFKKSFTITKIVNIITDKIFIYKFVCFYVFIIIVISFNKKKGEEKKSLNSRNRILYKNKSQ